jgi:hypothetical protein
MAMTYERAPVQKMGGSSSLAELLDRILDKGIVIDAWVRISVVGIEILTIEARVVVASVETYLRYAEAVGLTALAAAPPAQEQNQRTSVREEGKRAEGEPPSDEEVLGYLSDHPEGLRLGEIAAFFDAPRRAFGDILNRLVDQDKARRDDERKIYLPAEGEEEE